MMSSGRRLPKLVKSASQSAISGISSENRIIVKVDACSGSTRWSKPAQAGMPMITTRPAATAVAWVERLTSARNALRSPGVWNAWPAMGTIPSVLGTPFHRPGAALA